jgi:dGTPase
MRERGDRFNHNLHALHIVEQFEQRYLEFPGLNLTFEVREGIVKHSGNYSATEFPALAEYLLDQQPPLEAQLIDLVDEIAYNTADLDDGFEARLVDLDLLRAEVPIFNDAYSEIDRRYPQGRRKLKFNETLKQILNRLATDLIDNTSHQVLESGIETLEDVRRLPNRLASFSPEIARRNAELKRFLHARLYSNPAIAEDRDRSVASLDALFLFFMEHPDRMPKQYAESAQSEPRHRVVCDYIAGMTDHFLLRQRNEILGSAAGHAN